MKRSPPKYNFQIVYNKGSRNIHAGVLSWLQSLAGTTADNWDEFPSLLLIKQFSEHTKINQVVKTAMTPKLCYKNSRKEIELQRDEEATLVSTCLGDMALEKLFAVPSVFTSANPRFRRISKKEMTTAQFHNDFCVDTRRRPTDWVVILFIADENGIYAAMCPTIKLLSLTLWKNVFCKPTTIKGWRNTLAEKTMPIYPKWNALTITRIRLLYSRSTVPNLCEKPWSLTWKSSTITILSNSSATNINSGRRTWQINQDYLHWLTPANHQWQVHRTYQGSTCEKCLHFRSVQDICTQTDVSYSYFKELLTENGKCFTAKFFYEVCRIFSICNSFTTTQNSKINVQVEKSNRTLKAATCSYFDDHPTDRDLYTPALIYAYNCLPLTSTASVLFELVLSKPPPPLALTTY